MKMMFVVFSALLSYSVNAQNKYVYTADIKNIVDDKISVELQAPTITEDEVVFSFPKVIPGSYSEKNYGRYIDDLTAYDAVGKKLKVKKLNPNQFTISGATGLKKITYKVNDTWDTPLKDFIFQPGGSNIESNSNVIINNFAFFGYFEGYKQLPFEINITKPAMFYASTHLQVDRKDAESDVLTAKDYAYLADNPVFYCVPDTSSFNVGSSVIHVSVFSATGKVKSAQVAGYLTPMAAALGKFFNGLPVTSYQFLLYFENPDKAIIDRKSGGGYGALEHNYSSLYFLPEQGYEPRLKTMVNEVTSHEFLHIQTPLNLHSDEIEHFNFINPKMSKQLWMYEGVTEYFANLVQVQNGLLTEKQFFNNMHTKITEAAEYGDFSMTEMSENVLTPAFRDKYGSVYNKGALIGLALDLEIRQKTGGQKDLKQVIVSLTKKYGAGKPFNDSTFLDEFVAASHPDIQAFIDKYIVGGQPLPYAYYFNMLGYDYQATKRTDIYLIGKMGLKYDDVNKAFVFTGVDRDNALGIKEEDVFISIQGTPATAENIDEVWEKYFQNNTTLTQVSMVVKRKEEEKTLSGPLDRGYTTTKNYIAPLDNPTAEQRALLAKYLTGK